jgi:hypothetical protein
MTEHLKLHLEVYQDPGIQLQQRKGLMWIKIFDNYHKLKLEQWLIPKTLRWELWNRSSSSLLKINFLQRSQWFNIFDNCLKLKQEYIFNTLKYWSFKIDLGSLWNQLHCRSNPKPLHQCIYERVLLNHLLDNQLFRRHFYSRKWIILITNK